ncbi:hypothetical protein [Microbacterium sp. NPDC055665]
MVTWYTADSEEAEARLLAAWRDAPLENEEVCQFILDAAKDQVIAFAPALPIPVEGEPVPDPPSRYVYAQLQQAKNLLMAGSVARGGEYSEGEFSYEPRPLDKAIKNLIRPIDGKPDVY